MTHASHAFNTGQMNNGTQSNFTHTNDVSQNSNQGQSIPMKFANTVEKRILSRWDDCLNNKRQAQLLPNQSHQKRSSHPPLDSTVVREFLPRTASDPILSILRELFVRSFDQFYKEIELQLKLKTNETLAEWLQGTFDSMQDDIINRKHRCFMLCSIDEITENDSKQGIIGFLTLAEEDKGSIYIAQCAIEAENKRRGYGARLMRHLRTIYPAGTFYWGLCRRVNRPAVNFYLKHGAKCIDDEEVANKYGYDPALYTGFQFTDGMGSHTQSNASDTSFFLSGSSTVASVPESVLTRRPHVTYQNNSTMTDDSLLDIGKRPFYKRNSCCVIS